MPHETIDAPFFPSQLQRLYELQRFFRRRVRKQIAFTRSIHPPSHLPIVQLLPISSALDGDATGAWPSCQHTLLTHLERS